MPSSGEVPDAASRAAREELIGIRATVVASGHPNLTGTVGLVVDETARTFVLEKDDGREVVIPKIGQRFAFDLPGGAVELDGRTLAIHPIERLKRKR